MPDSYHSLSDRIFVAAFSCWLAALPLSKAVVSILTVVLIAVSLWRYLEHPVKLNRRDYLAFFVVSALFWIYAISLLWSDDFPSGMAFMKSQVFLIAVPFIILFNRSLISTENKRFVSVFIAAVCLSWLAAVIIHFLPDQVVRQMASNERLFLPYSEGNRGLFGMYSPFITRIQLSNFLGIGVIFSIFAFVKYRASIFIITGIWCLSGLILLGGRGGQVGFFVAFAVFALFNAVYIGKTMFSKITLGLGVILLLGLSGYLLMFHVEPVKSRYAQHRYETALIKSGEYIHHDYYHFTSLRRLVSWQNSIAMIREQPVLGTGIGDYQKARELKYEKDDFDLPLNNHSQYLHIAGASGIAGLSIWLISLFIWTGILFTKKARFAHRVSAISCIVLYFVAMLPDALLLKQVDIVHFSFLLSWWIWTDQ